MKRKSTLVLGAILLALACYVSGCGKSSGTTTGTSFFPTATM